jgi:Lrp/AsnC family leucine-responsive transcriptional regulator
MEEKYSAERLDDIDIKILKVLQSNAKITTKELATTVNLSPTPVFERQKRLEQEGYIKKYVAILDAEKLNNSLLVFCNIRLKEHTGECGKHFMKAIKEIKEVAECYNISGNYDFMMKIYVSSMKHYQDFVLNTLGKISSIGSLHSIFVIAEIKSTNELPL